MRDCENVRDFDRMIIEEIVARFL